MKKRHCIPALFGCLFALLAGCATVQGDWGNAGKSDPVYAYQAFPGSHPNSEFDGQARTRIEEIDWANALKQGDVYTCSTFKRKHPKSPRVKEAEERMAELEWGAAKKTDSEGSYAGFLQRLPSSPHANEAGKRMRELKFERARKGESVAYIEEFLKACPQGDGSETLRRELPAVRVWEPRKILTELVIPLCPKTAFTMQELMGGKVGAQPETCKSDLAAIRSRHDKPGMTLLEYCKANGLTEAHEILKSHRPK